MYRGGHSTPTPKNIAIIIVSLCFVFSFYSCKSPFGEDFGEIIRTGDIIEGTGTVTFIGLEGGVLWNNNRQ